MTFDWGPDIFFSGRVRYRSLYKAQQIKFWQEHLAPELLAFYLAIRGMCIPKEAFAGPLPNNSAEDGSWQKKSSSRNFLYNGV